MSGYTKDIQVDYSTKIGATNEEFSYPLKYNGIEYDKYRLSNQGYIQNVETGKYLTAYSYGHNLQGRIYNNGQPTTIYLARAVLENFLNIKFSESNNYRIIFKDNDITNCSIDNLIYEPYDPDRPNKYEYTLYGDYGEVDICGYKVLLDTDFILNELPKYKFWPKVTNSESCYFLSTGSKARTSGLHQLVVRYYRPEYEYYDRVVDHINVNTLDCRNENLRCVSASLNSMNQAGKLYSKTPTGYRTSARIDGKDIGKRFFLF